MVKINVSAFIESTLHLQYEKQIGKKRTVAFGIAIRPKAGLPFPFKSYIESIIDHDGVDIDHFRMNAILLTPEIRFYLGRGEAFHGLYIAPYLRAGFYKMSGPVYYASQSQGASGLKSVVFDGRLTTISGGGMGGYVFHLSKQFYLDCWIAGASFGYLSTNMRGNSDLSNQADREGLTKVMNALKIPLTRLTHNEDVNGATVKTTGAMVGLRGFGLNLGIRF